ncbi:MAG: hypothetical protein VX464_11650 [Pseudomonadota bacterium]|nr:hypothetical protein [Pseudomonadota bacterium]
MSFISDLFSSSAPKGPDPNTLIGQQSAANTDVARMNAKLNRIDSYTPFGSVTFQDLGDDRWKSEQTLSPGMQGLLDQQVSIGGGVNDAALARLGNLTNDRFSLDGIADFQSSIDDQGLMAVPTAESLDAYAQRAEDSVYGRHAARLDDRYGRAEDQLRARLENQGITQGSDAYSDAMRDFGYDRTDAYNQATTDAITQGSALRSQLLADSLSGRQQGLSERYTAANFGNQGRQQEINDRLLERTQGLNELAALLQGQQAIATPQQQGGAPVSVAPPDVGGAYGLSQAAQNNAYNSKKSSQNAAIGGLSSLGAAYLLAG